MSDLFLQLQPDGDMDAVIITLLIIMTGAGAVGGVISYYLHRWQLSRALDNVLQEAQSAMEIREWANSIETPKTKTSTTRKTRSSTTRKTSK